MTTTFLSPSPLHRITELPAKAIGFAAVPFIGKDGAKLLPLKAKSLLVTRFDEASVAAGHVSPAEILKLLKRGVAVHACANLHAKVYVFGKRAIVGSANVSTSSLALMEAAVESTDVETVAAAKQFILNLTGDPVGDAYAESLLPLYPVAQERGRARGGAQAATAQHSRLWVATINRDIDWQPETQAVDDAVQPLALEAISDPDKHRLDSLEVLDRDWQKLATGDRVVQRSVKGRGFEFDPPARVIRIEPVGSGAILYLERPKRLRLVSSAAARERLGADVDAFTVRGNNLQLVRRAASAHAFPSLWPSLRSIAAD